jgi:hypothetical protein
MWFFFRRWRERHQAPTVTTKPRPLSFQQITHGFGDFSDFQRHNTALKFWLPEPAEQALKEFCDIADQSISEWLRQFFVVYAYGLLALTVLNERCPGFFRDDRGVRFSRNAPQDPPGKKRVTTYWVPEMGKNIVPIKVWIPARMKADLQILADHAQIPLSQLAREIVISRLLGHGTLPARAELTRAELTHAEPTACNNRRRCSRLAGMPDSRWSFRMATKPRCFRRWPINRIPPMAMACLYCNPSR